MSCSYAIRENGILLTTMLANESNVENQRVKAGFALILIFESS
jgi:hypothetical protein